MNKSNLIKYITLLNNVSKLLWKCWISNYVKRHAEELAPLLAYKKDSKNIFTPLRYVDNWLKIWSLIWREVISSRTGITMNINSVWAEWRFSVAEYTCWQKSGKGFLIKLIWLKNYLFYLVLAFNVSPLSQKTKNKTKPCRACTLTQRQNFIWFIILPTQSVITSLTQMGESAPGFQSFHCG